MLLSTWPSGKQVLNSIRDLPSIINPEEGFVQRTGAETASEKWLNYGIEVKVNRNVYIKLHTRLAHQLGAYRFES